MATRPFYGDPANSAPVWQKAAVLLGSLTATKPTGTPSGGTVATRGFILNDPAAGTPITTEWDPVGALDDDSPFDDGAESIETTSHSAFGLGVYAKTFKNQEFQFTFTALQEDLITAGLIFDASGLTETGGMVSGDEGLRDPSETFLLGIVRENANKVQRRVTKNYAQIDNIAPAFSDGKALKTVTVTVYPDSSGLLWARHEWAL
jgi:hypothetical protein